MRERELCYIASPLRGDVEGNIQNAMRYCAKAVEEGYIPIAPHAMYRGMFNDEIPAQRAAALDIGLQLMERCSHIWVCGDVVSEGMRGEIELARRRGMLLERKPEAYFQPRDKAVGPNTFESLRASVSRAVEEGCKTPDGIWGLLQAKAKHMPYSLQNAVAIEKQDPSATRLLTYHQWREAGFRVEDTRRSVKVWAPVTRTTFERGGAETEVRKATAAERTAIGRGEIRLHQRTVYRMDALYDIAQTNCQPAEYLQLERGGAVPGNPLSALNHTEKYECLRAAAVSCGFTVVESTGPMAALSPSSRDGNLVVSGRVHISQRLSDLCQVYADALVAGSSTQAPAVMDFESYALAFLLQSQMDLPELRERPLYLERAAAVFQSAPALFEESMGRVQRMANHIDEGLRSVLQERGLYVGPEQTAKKEQRVDQRAVNQNFMQEIE